jgi:hypothetical protein
VIPFIAFFPLIWELLFVKPDKPIVEHGEFPFELVYEYKGEQVTIKDSIICDYEGISFSLEGGNSRDWNCSFSNDDEYGHYYVDRELDLYIVVPEAAEYYMGDIEEDVQFSLPYIHYIDESTGTYYEEIKRIDVVDIEIVEWKPSSPLENNFK